MVNKTEIRDWVIYKITNPNGRVYIGKTSNYPARVRQYRCLQLKRQDLIMRSIVKYGWDSHKIEVVDSFVATGHQSECKEMFWIRSNLSNICKYPEQKGMNMTDGGEGVLGIKRSDKYRDECRERNLGKRLTDEHKKAIGDSLRGRPGSNNGYKHTEEWKMEASARKKGKRYRLGHLASDYTKSLLRAAKLGTKDPEDVVLRKTKSNVETHGIPVIVTTVNGVIVGEFRSQAECARYFSMTKNCVLNRIRLGETRTKKGASDRYNQYIFKYKDNAA